MTAPDQPSPRTGRDIIIVLYLLYLFWPPLSFRVLTSSGFFESFYGPDVMILCRLQNDENQPTQEQQDEARTQIAWLAGPGAAQLDVIEKEARRMAMIRLNMWSAALAFPLQALTIPIVFFALSRTPPRQIGLTWQNFGRNVLLGIRGWLLITPIVYIIYLLTMYLYSLSDPSAVEEHPLTRLAHQRPSPAEWALLIFSATVIAPVLEEMIFRGMLQLWFAGFRIGGHVAIATALVASILLRQTQLVEAWRQGGEGLLEAAMPALFVLALVPFYLLVFRNPPRADSPAVFGTALLFALVHASVWPTPIPLFALGLALGTLASRTGSLVGPIVLHALFNAVTCVGLIMGS